MVKNANASERRGSAADRVRLLGIDFFIGTIGGACQRAGEGGLVVAPSGPGMAYDLVRDPTYRRALETSDLALTDSAFMVHVWWLRTGIRLPRISGFAFLKAWLGQPSVRRAGAVLWVMPSEAEAERTLRWLQRAGFELTRDDLYVAPIYADGPVVDLELLSQVEARRPTAVYLGIGGGVQERVGLFLRARLSYRPTILCLGAALAFMTGGQVNIPPWVDRAGLGWFWRIASNPRVYSKRYLRATRLVGLIFRYRAASPPFRRPVD